MSTIQVTKIDFESTSNNRISFSPNTITIGVAGSNVVTINSTAIGVLNPLAANGTTRLTNGSVVANTLTVSGGISVQGIVNFNGVTTPTAINVNTAAFAPGANNTIVRFSANSSNNSELSVYGMVAGVNGQVVVLSNIGTKVIRISNEDAANETTAANRFSLPQTVYLNGYQSMSLIYDGSVSRWKPIDYSGPTFYKSFLSKGFIAAADANILNYNDVDRTTYATETTSIAPTAAINQSRAGAAGVGNSIKGFTLGGGTCVSSFPTTQGRVATAERTDFATETSISVPGANLSAARNVQQGAGNDCKAFIAGGRQYTAPATFIVRTTDRLTYASEVTVSVPGAQLSANNVDMVAAGNSDKGFFNGYSAAAPLGGTDRITYASETTAAVPGANRSQDKYAAMAAGNGDKGFFVGGTGPAGTPVVCTSFTTAERITYASETLSAVPGSNLTTARGAQSSGTGNGCKGFFYSGCLANPVPTLWSIPNVACRTNYITETTASVPGAILSLAKSYYSVF